MAYIPIMHSALSTLTSARLSISACLGPDRISPESDQAAILQSIACRSMTMHSVSCTANSACSVNRFRAYPVVYRPATQQVSISCGRTSVHCSAEAGWPKIDDRGKAVPPPTQRPSTGNSSEGLQRLLLLGVLFAGWYESIFRAN